MNLFIFLETTPFELIFQTLCSALLLLLVAPIGYFFMGDTKNLVSQSRLFTATTIGLIFLSTLATILLTFAPLLVKPLIGAAFILSLPIWLINQKEVIKFRSWGAWYGRYIQTIGIYLILIILFVLFWITAKSSISFNGISFNGHENYFSGIALEIYHANYWGRLKIFDNFPFEWSKFHFFTGTITSFPLFFFLDKNLASFQLARIIIFCLLICALIEAFMPQFQNWKSKSDKRIGILILIALTLFVTQVFAQQLWWNLYTNGFTSVFLLLLFFATISHNKNMFVAFFF